MSASDLTEPTMREYYQARANVYDDVYAYPERQHDLRWFEAQVASAFRDCDVLEIAAGTGYWTQFLSRGACSILALDANAGPLQELSSREFGCPVTTRIQDAYALEQIDQLFSGGFAGLWWSHVLLQQRKAWLASFCTRMQPGATIVMIDNTAAQCQRLPITHTDELGNTYQDRQLFGGGSYRVLKNFPTEQALREDVQGLGDVVRYEQHEHFWWFEFTTSA